MNPTQITPPRKPVTVHAVEPEPVKPTTDTGLLQPSDAFPHRHIGPDEHDVQEMLKTVGVKSVDQLIDQTVPDSIRLRRPLKLEGGSDARGEFECAGAGRGR